MSLLVKALHAAMKDGKTGLRSVLEEHKSIDKPRCRSCNTCGFWVAHSSEPKEWVDCPNGCDAKETTQRSNGLVLTMEMMASLKQKFSADKIEPYSYDNKPIVGSREPPQ